MTLAAPAFKDVPLLRLADRHRAQAAQSPAATVQRWPTPPPSTAQTCPKRSNTAGTVKVAARGAHFQRPAAQLAAHPTRRACSARGAVRARIQFLRPSAARSSGLAWCAGNEGGADIDMEVWELPAEHFWQLADGIPAPLGIGKSSWPTEVVGERVCVRGDWG
ncbi:MAG: hypothetical protein R3E56_00050 [Burkholderiaceae bacterium]